jgi:large subunit ribosomal protein L19
MSSVISAIEAKVKKHDVVNVKSGDTVRVHQKIKEGNKERIQIFEGLVIRTDRKGSHTSSITVRRIASGVGVEKTYLLHSPLVEKVEVTKRSKVRRNYLTYMRERTGKSARLASVDFDRSEVNSLAEAPKEEPAKTEATAEETPAPEAASAPAEKEVKEETKE